MSRVRLALVAAAAVLTAAAAPAPPPEPTTLKSGPNLDAVQTYCRICHSVDYITTQPPGVAAGFWQAEVTKMVKTFGAPIPDEQAARIVDYLNATYRRSP